MEAYFYALVVNVGFAGIPILGSRVIVSWVI
jgi:hypothetical protein